MAKKGLIPGVKVKYNGNAPRSFRADLAREFIVDKITILPKGSKKGASIGVLTMCKRKDVTLVFFVNHPKYTTGIPERFLSITK